MYIVEVSGNSTRPDRPDFVSATMRVIILKQKPKDAQFSKLLLIQFLKQSTKPSENEIYF